jgi:hypothetical protein
VRALLLDAGLDDPSAALHVLRHEEVVALYQLLAGGRLSLGVDVPDVLELELARIRMGLLRERHLKVEDAVPQLEELAKAAILQKGNVRADP